MTKKSLHPYAVTTKQFSSSGNKEDAVQQDETLEVHDFVTEPAHVRLSMGTTVNIGNYESVRVEVSLSVPCYKEEINDAYAFARSWVEKRVLAESDLAKNFAKSRTARSVDDLF